MKGTLFSTDFVVDQFGNEKLLEINTDTSFLDSALTLIDFTDFLNLLENNNITEVNVIYKQEIHSNFVEYLSNFILNNAPFITNFIETKVPFDSIFPASPEDGDNKFILRMSYDETAILDSEYAKGKLNTLALFHENNDTGSVVNFYHSSSIHGVYDSLKNVINDDNVPDVTIKSIFEQQSSCKFYKLGKSYLSNEDRYNELKSSLSNENTMIQEYEINDTSVVNNRVTSLRSFYIVYGSNLDIIDLTSYRINSILELPSSISGEVESTKIDNLLNSKHYYEYVTNFPKSYRVDIGGFLGEHKVVMQDGNFKKLSEISVGDVVESYFISGSPQNDNVDDVANWFHTGNSFPEGSYLTSSVVVSVFENEIVNNALNEITIDNTDKIYTSTKNSFLVYDSGSNKMMYKPALNLKVNNDYLIDYSGSITPITENNFYILENENQKTYEIDVEDADTYFISGSNHLNSSMVVVHNVRCFVAGTKVTMGDKTNKNIEDVKVGEEVVTFNEEKRENEIKKVIDSLQPIHNDLVTYNFDNGIQITSTHDHPFYVNNFELASFKPNLTNERYGLNKEVKQIKEGDMVHLIDSNCTISSINELPIENTQTYIITVEDNHNFYANSILVHNK